MSGQAGGAPAARRAVVEQLLPNGRFAVRLEDGAQRIEARLAGRARIDLVRLIPGDRVLVERSPLDPSRGRIVGKV